MDLDNRKSKIRHKCSIEMIYTHNSSYHWHCFPLNLRFVVGIITFWVKNISKGLTRTFSALHSLENEFSQMRNSIEVLHKFFWQKIRSLLTVWDQSPK